MALRQLLYMSSLLDDDQEVVRRIVEVAARNNARRRITGMMLYSEGNVLQVLEGEEAALQETFRFIESDVRHSGIIVLIDEEIEAREFAGWHLGFKQLSKAEMDQLDPMHPLFNGNPPNKSKASQALLVMQSFVQDWRWSASKPQVGQSELT